MHLSTMTSTENMEGLGYEALKKFLGLYVEWYFPVVAKGAGHPIAFLEQLEKTSPSKAKRGLEMAVNDIVESSSDWRLETVADANARFMGAGAPTLSDVRRHFSKRYLRVLARGLIRSEAEYYLVKGVRDGVAHLDASEIEQLDSLLVGFEERVRKD